SLVGSLRGAATAGGTGEGLGDGEPLLGVSAGGDQVGVVAVHALGDQATEVVGGAGHLLCGVLGAVRPHLARRGGEFDAELLGRGLELVVLEGVVAGAHTDVGDV